MNVTQAFQYLSEASDEEIYEYERVDIVLNVLRRLAKAVSRYPIRTPSSSNASQDLSASSNTPNSLEPQSAHVFRPVQGILSSSYASLKDSVVAGPLSTNHYDPVRNPCGTTNPVLFYQNPKKTEPSTSFLFKAIKTNISWVWNLRYKSIPLIINENTQHTDVRIRDILRVEGKAKPTQEENLIARTAQRSFGIQYEREKKSRVLDIHVALHSPSLEVQKSLIKVGRGGQVRDFVKERICPESHRDFDLVVRSTNIGIKELTFEHELSYSYPSWNSSSASILTSTIKNIFHNKLQLTNILEFITELCHLPPFTVRDDISGDKLDMHIFDIINGVSPWYDEFQNAYDQHVQGKLEEAAQSDTYPIQTRSSDGYTALPQFGTSNDLPAPYKGCQNSRTWRPANHEEFNSTSGQRLPALRLPRLDIIGNNTSYITATNERQQVSNGPLPIYNSSLAADPDPYSAIPRVPTSPATQDNTCEASGLGDPMERPSAEDTGVGGEFNQLSSLGDGSIDEIDFFDPMLDLFLQELQPSLRLAH